MRALRVLHKLAYLCQQLVMYTLPKDAALLFGQSFLTHIIDRFLQLVLNSHRYLRDAPRSYLGPTEQVLFAPKRQRQALTCFDHGSGNDKCFEAVGLHD